MNTDHSITSSSVDTLSSIQGTNQLDRGQSKQSQKLTQMSGMKGDSCSSVVRAGTLHMSKSNNHEYLSKSSESSVGSSSGEEDSLSNSSEDEDSSSDSSVSHSSIARPSQAGISFTSADKKVVDDCFELMIYGNARFFFNTAVESIASKISVAGEFYGVTFYDEDNDMDPSPAEGQVRVDAHDSTVIVRESEFFSALEDFLLTTCLEKYAKVTERFSDSYNNAVNAVFTRD